MSQGTQSVVFNAVPLVVLAAAYLGVSVGFLPALWHERARAGLVDGALALLFPALTVVAAALAAQVLAGRHPAGGHLWLALAGILVAMLPALLILARWGERAAIATGPMRAREAAAVRTAHDRELEAIARLSDELARTHDDEEVARLLLDSVHGLFGTEFGGLALVSEDASTATGLLARSEGRDLEWWRGVRLDLQHEPSGIASAYFEAAPVFVYDCEASTRVSRRLVDATGAKSAVYVPLVAESRVIGVMAVAATQERRTFSPGDLSLLQALASDAALALERTRSAAALAKSLERERALVRAAQALSSALELEAVLQSLADQVAELLSADAADCYLLDAERGVLRCAAVHGLPDDLIGFEFPAGRGAAGLAVQRERPVVARDYSELPHPVPHPAYEGFTDAIVAPMQWSGAVQGVLGVGARGGRTFEEGDADVLEAFAGLASLALRNAETFTERSRQARVQRGFYRVASVLGQSLSLGATLEAIAQAAAEALGGASAAVLMPRGRTLTLAGSHELPEAIAAALAAGLPPSASTLANAARDRRIVASPKLVDDDRFGDDWRELVREAGGRALVSIPVATPRHEGAGLVIVLFARERVFTDDDLELASHLADATRGALERADLFEAERTSRALAQQLAHTGSLLATELDPAAVLDEVIGQARALLSVDGSAIRVLEGDELVVAAAEGDGAEAAVTSREPSTAWLAGDVVQSRAHVALGDIGDDARLRAADPMLAAGHCAYLGVPLAGPEGTLHGVLSVYSCEPRDWRGEEIDALRALAGNTAAALSNAELYQRVALEKERSFAILANIADGIVAVDREGNVVLWNQAAEGITGVPAEEALGRTPAQVLRRNLESDGFAQPGDRLVSILRGNEEVWLSLTEAVMRDPAGAVSGRIFAFRDISADRLLEQMKTEFVSLVSQRLRAPLTSIYGFSETLLRRDVAFGEEERLTFLGYIASEAERLTQIVDELLSVARLDTGDLQVNLAAIDVRSVVTEVVQTVEQAESDGHEFVLDLPEGPLSAEADRDKLRQVFSILVDNAVRYSPDGGKVTVGARRKSDVLEVRVIDQGIGVPEAERERIFRKFYRGEGGGENGGTGLGLFIAQGLVTAMGGRIWVDSAEGKGSSFAFELPLAAAAVGERD